MARAKKAPAYGITQNQLEAYRFIKADLRRLTTDLEARRKVLLAAFDSESPVEPGALAPQVSIREVRRMTPAEITRILGAEALAEIQTQLSPSIERTFSVVEVGTAA
jgi:hypothetical protein